MAGTKARPRVAVLGGGIAGLSAAYEIVRRAAREGGEVEVAVLEGAQRPGGKVLTESRDGATVEAGPDSFLTAKPDVLELVRELGLESELIGTDPAQRSVSICLGGRLRPMPWGASPWPDRIWPLLTTGVLTWRGKLRAAAEPWVPRGEGAEDESLADFIRRRLGNEALERLIDPMLAGIYAGDSEKLSLESTFPQLKELERRGGLLRGRARAASGAARPAFMTLKGGLSRLIDALCLRLPAGTVRTGARIKAVCRRGDLWQVVTENGSLEADAVVSALPAPALAEVVENLDLELATALRDIPFASTATVSLLYDEAALPRRLSGYGFLVPRGEGRAISAATFTSTKFPERAVPGRALVRCFLGGAGREAAAEVAETRVIETARRDLDELLDLRGAKPLWARAWRWTKANPQYNVGHGLRLWRIRSCLRGHARLFLSGSSYDGVGLPDCVRSGRGAGVEAWRAVAPRATAARR